MSFKAFATAPSMQATCVAFVLCQAKIETFRLSLLVCRVPGGVKADGVCPD